MNFILRGKIVTPTEVLEDNALVIQGDKIYHILENDVFQKFADDFSKNYKIIEFDNDKYICPGLIDIHTHGAIGKDFMNSNIDDNKDIANFYLKNGVTSFVATTMTNPKENILKAIIAAKEYSKLNIASSELIGIHVEGPYINKEEPIFYGAQNPIYIKEMNIKEIDEFIEAGEGLIRRITVAPEGTPGSSEIIRYLVKNNVIVSIGHSNSNFEEAKEAFDAGLNLITHLYNASGTWHHRATGIIGAALLDKRVYCETICDGHHVHPSAIEMTYIVKTPEKMITITDSTSGAGMADGEEFDLGGQRATVNEGVCRLVKDGMLAGSALTLNKALYNVNNWIDISLPQLVNTATLNPAILFGLDKEIGSIEKGKKADIAVFDGNFIAEMVIKKGEILYKK